MVNSSFKSVHNNNFVIKFTVNIIFMVAPCINNIKYLIVRLMHSIL